MWLLTMGEIAHVRQTSCARNIDQLVARANLMWDFPIQLPLGKQRGLKGFQDMSNFAQIDILLSQTRTVDQTDALEKQSPDYGFSVKKQTAAKVQGVTHQGAALWA
jgi:hypothetical protein